MQIALPNEVTPLEIERSRTLGDAIALCVRAAGYEPKEVMDVLRIDGKAMDKGQWSRWESGEEGVKWPKFAALMDHCGNDAPVLWMAHARGYELTSLHKRESETERQLRLAREEIAALRRALHGATA